MSFGNRLWSGVLAVWVALTLSGCLPSGQNQSEEEKEPHFVLGKSRINAMDYQGAIQAFEESLEVNPHSAAAHFELGWLYDEKESDPAAAIYHYQQYLKFDPDAGNTEVIKQRIESCKQQLAADVLPLPSTPAAQKQINQLIEQNQQLQDEVNKWRAYYASQLAAKNQAAPAPGPEVAQTSANPVSPPPAQNVPAPARQPGRDRPARSTPTKATTHLHIVTVGETAVRIARRYGISLDALLAANPGLEPRRMRVGQVLNIPSP
ncbi:MAG TPA: LysM peptidoglycan-binding domain-containing protein [Verrucomicrobiae bacterium]|nr:LysM peptidoglycan-binding domain-containing protein [Verrucomicrobiae bacterium]